MKSNRYFIIDDIISIEELNWLYQNLINSKSWSLTWTSKKESIALMPFNSFPGITIEDHGKIFESYLSGYFKSIQFRIYSRIKSLYSYELPCNIVRTAVCAKSSLSNSSIHLDSSDKDRWTILAFLNPSWDMNDGGEFYIENEKIDFIPGRVIVFPSFLMHNGGNVKAENHNDWRMVLNIIVDKKY